MGSLADLLELLPGELRIARGSVRLFISFRDGRLDGDVKVAVFRVPAKDIDRVSARPAQLDRDRLEHIAKQLQLDEGLCELVVEYTNQGNGPQLHWIDFSWNQAPA